MYRISMKDLPALCARLAAQGDLYVPARNRAGKTDYAKWKEGVEPDLHAYLTAKSLKDIFFPQVENIYNLKTDGTKISLSVTEPSDTLTVALGVRACDARSFQILDKVFLQEPVDAYYKKRRERTVLIGLGCSEPEETCFCGTFGIDAAEPETDIVTWLVPGSDGESLFWNPVTEKGRALTESLKDLLAEAADETAVNGQKDQVRAILKKLPLGDFRISPKLTADELKTFNSSVWDQVCEGCLSCCACTYVCPTCHCYDIRDYMGEEGSVSRYRCWDSCMNRDFTKMAAANPRKTKKERFRQRYMHKLVYFPENNNGVYACVGCGRCLNRCPVNHNIVKVAKALEASDDV